MHVGWRPVHDGLLGNSRPKHLRRRDVGSTRLHLAGRPVPEGSLLWRRRELPGHQMLQLGARWHGQDVLPEGRQLRQVHGAVREVGRHRGLGLQDPRQPHPVGARLLLDRAQLLGHGALLPGGVRVRREGRAVHWLHPDPEALHLGRAADPDPERLGGHDHRRQPRRVPDAGRGRGRRQGRRDPFLLHGLPAGLRRGAPEGRREGARGEHLRL
mmetsp:Transcript_126476/g.343317  ORF Transcript_126476/g.343317 Transcript_126476/m.343317 type:complete len:213 (-) Transcript_126476:1204-1842(-)